MGSRVDRVCARPRLPDRHCSDGDGQGGCDRVEAAGWIGGCVCQRPARQTLVWWRRAGLGGCCRSTEPLVLIFLRAGRPHRAGSQACSHTTACPLARPGLAWPHQPVSQCLASGTDYSPPGLVLALAWCWLAVPQSHQRQSRPASRCY